MSTASIRPIDIGTIIQTLISTTASRGWAIPTLCNKLGRYNFGSRALGDFCKWLGKNRSSGPITSKYQIQNRGSDQRPMDEGFAKTITEIPPPPAITHDGVTIRPIAVTRQTTVSLSDGLITTNGQVEFEVAVGSLTLSMGNPVTIDNVVFDVTTDTAGSTVLHAGDLTTTLPQPTAGEVRTITEDTHERLSIATAVISGTTKYIFAGQTLAPGQPVTIGGTPISITTSGGGTVLYVGDRTTTLPAAGDMQTLTDWATISAGTWGTAAYTQPVSAVPTSKKSDSAATRKLDAALVYLFMGITIFAFAL
ncbi:hypothetical protein N0V86_005782 [Didymella sp. IMI 355093]|nr:hypothetical protein N0V86_005782 [Didymella sp. IMI 355093]